MTAEIDALLADVRERLAAAADAERAAQMQAYMKSAMPYHGVPLPAVRRLLDGSAAEHPLDDGAWLDAVRRMWDEATHREERYAALALARRRTHRAAATEPARLPLYRYLVVSGAWWDLVDEIAQHLVGPVLRAHPDIGVPTMLAWAEDDDLWVRRTAMICQVGAGEATDPTLLDGVLRRNLDDSLHGRAFWIRKALGWALRDYARADPEWVRAWVAGHEGRLSVLSRREAMKHL